MFVYDTLKNKLVRNQTQNKFKSSPDCVDAHIKGAKVYCLFYFVDSLPAMIGNGLTTGKS